MTTSTVNAPKLPFIEQSSLAAAVLPYWPVWAAAQFASTEEYKGMLNFVHIWCDGDAYQIESSDGHRAFRYRFPAAESYWRVPDDGLLLYAKPLKKSVSYAKFMTVTADLRAIFHGGKTGNLAELSSINTAGFYSVHTVDDYAKVGRYPEINKLWPSSFTNEPGRPFAFNCRYLKEWCAIVDRLSPNGVTRCTGNSPTTPFVWSADYEPCIGQHFDDPKLEYLLMPVLIREN